MGRKPTQYPRIFRQNSLPVGRVFLIEKSDDPTNNHAILISPDEAYSCLGVESTFVRETATYTELTDKASKKRAIDMLSKWKLATLAAGSAITFLRTPDVWIPPDGT